MKTREEGEAPGFRLAPLLRLKKRRSGRGLKRQTETRGRGRDGEVRRQTERGISDSKKQHHSGASRGRQGGHPEASGQLWTRYPFAEASAETCMGKQTDGGLKGLAPSGRRQLWAAGLPTLLCSGRPWAAGGPAMISQPPAQQGL